MASITDGNNLAENQGLNPLVNFNFMLRVELAFDLPCRRVQAFSRELEYDYIQEGGLNDYVHMRRKPITRPFTLEVERYVGLDYVDPLRLGAELVLPLILLVSRRPEGWKHGEVTRAYAFTGCCVMKKTFGELSGDNSGLLLETTTIGYRELHVVDLPHTGKDVSSEKPDASHTGSQSSLKETIASLKEKGNNYYESAQKFKKKAHSEFSEKKYTQLLANLNATLKKVYESTYDTENPPEKDEEFAAPTTDGALVTAVKNAQIKLDGGAENAAKDYDIDAIQKNGGILPGSMRDQLKKAGAAKTSAAADASKARDKLDQLLKPVKEAEEAYRRAKLKLDKAETEYRNQQNLRESYQSRLMSMEEQLKQERIDQEVAELELEAIRPKLRDAERKKIISDSNLKQARKKLFRQDNELAELRKMQTRSEQELEECDDAIAAARKNLAEAEDGGDAGKITQARKEIQDQEVKHKDLVKLDKKYAGKIRTAEAERAELQADAAAAEEVSKNYFKVKETADKAKGAVDNAKKNQATLLNNIEALKKAKEESERRDENGQDQLSRAREAYLNAKKACDSAESELNTLKTKLSTEKEKESDSLTKLAKAQDDLSKKETSLAEAEAKESRLADELVKASQEHGDAMHKLNLAKQNRRPLRNSYDAIKKYPETVKQAQADCDSAFQICEDNNNQLKNLKDTFDDRSDEYKELKKAQQYLYAIKNSAGQVKYQERGIRDMVSHLARAQRLMDETPGAVKNIGTEKEPAK